jgi:ABC-type transport system involved in multi-copper enzyme maturation permease subunit
MKKILAVAGYIFKQSFRNKILNMLIIFAVFSMGFSLIISLLAQESELKMVVDFGLFTIEIFSFLTIALSLAVQMFEETEMKTVSLMLVKPIKRHEYLIGKYLGIVFTLFLNILFMLATMMVVIKLKGGDPWSLKMLLAVLYIFISMCILTSTAVLLEVVTTSVPSCIIFLFFVYVLGHLTVNLEHLMGQVQNQAVKIIIDVIYYVMPNMELFNLKDKIYTTEGLFLPRYFALVSGYAVIYVAISLTVASLIFDKKEF